MMYKRYSTTWDKKYQNNLKGASSPLFLCILLPLMMSDAIVLFDGVCNFCNYWVRFIMKHDKQKRFLFGTLQGTTATALLTAYGKDSLIPDSVVLIEKGKCYTQSTAVLRICKQLDGWPKIFYLLIIIPAPIRNTVYRWIAKNRYRWFGKMEQCMVPDASEQSRFVP